MSNNITRNEIAESIFKEIGLSRSECNEFVDTIVEYLITGIINDIFVYVRNRICRFDIQKFTRR